MSELAEYNYSTAAWRYQLQCNERRSRAVIALFILLYVTIGLLVDLYINPELSPYPLLSALKLLGSGQVVPVATLIAGLVALCAVMVTYALHDRLILLGTNSREITQESSRDLTERQLYHVVTELKIAAGMRYMPKIYLLEAEYMNAFASGYSERSAMIALTRGLLNRLERSELQAVIAHELSHIRHHDIKLTLMVTVLSNIMLIAVDLMLRGTVFGGERRRRSANSSAFTIIIIVLRFLLPLTTLLLFLYLSRKREFMADAGAVALQRDNVPLARALLKISSDHNEHAEEYATAYGNTPHEEVRYAAYIFNPKPLRFSVTPSLTSIFSTHPSLSERLQALGFTRKGADPSS